MIKFLEPASDHVIAVEFEDGYTVEDEKNLEKAFEEKLSKGFEKVNLLARIDKLDISHTSWKAMWDDGMYALKHIKNCGKIAIVGHSKVEEILIKMDNSVFGSKKEGRIEKYFDVSELDHAMGWVNE